MARSLVCALLALLLALPAAAEPEVQRTPVEFRVVNRNRTPLPCSTDELAYHVRGELVLPAGAGRDLVTLALHEFSFGRFFWSLPGHPEHDLAAHMARAGHAWLHVDRLGYDGSDHPPGGATCLGAQADIAAQLVRALASGDYRFGERTHGPAFKRVVLAGHSVGAGIAELTAHSFPSLPLSGLALFAWADQGYSADTMRQSLEQGQDCAAGGQPAERGEPSGYAFFGRTAADFRRNMFFDTHPAVADAVTVRRNRDPCGDNASLVRLAAVNVLRNRDIALPVLLLFGEKDPVFTPESRARQAELFAASPDLQTRVIARAAHALTMERAAPNVRDHLLRWLAVRKAAASRTLHR